MSGQIVKAPQHLQDPGGLNICSRYFCILNHCGVHLFSEAGTLASKHPTPVALPKETP